MLYPFLWEMRDAKGMWWGQGDATWIGFLAGDWRSIAWTEYRWRAPASGAALVGLMIAAGPRESVDSASQIA